MVQLDIEKTLSELDLNEKIALTAGADFWHTVPIERLKIPSVRTSDGPNGVRGTRFFNGVPSACLPCSTALGSTWDVNLLEQIGELLGDEARSKGVHVLLGPTINIQRSPLGGRGFESFSEDGLLSGVLAGYYCKGVQSKGVGATLKHFVCNDQEHERMAVDTIVTARALREIYLVPFQQALRICQMACFMTAYNKINGCHVSENASIIGDILRKEWKWNGLVMSDWFGTYSTAEAINAGLDLEMPGPTRWRGSILNHAINSRKVADHVLDERVRNVLNLVNHAGKSDIPFGAEEKGLNRPEDQKLLRRAAAESIVLLRNNNSVLPFDKIKPIAVIGPNSKVAAYCGGGSASLPPYYTVTPFEGITNASKADVKFSQGAYAHQTLPPLGPLMKTLDGKKQGFEFKAYLEPPEERNSDSKPVDELHLVNSTGFLADYKNPRIPGQLFYADMEGTFTPAEDGLYDFGVIVIGSGKLFIDGELVVDNATTQRQGTAMFGSATVEEKGSKELKGGTSYKILFQYGSRPTSKLENRSVIDFGLGGFAFGTGKRIDKEESIKQAVDLASKMEQVILVAGLNGEWETEGNDREHMDLPPGTDELISRVLDVNPNVAVVIQSGTPVTMPWIDKANVLAQAWFGGNELGNGLADVLYGDVNPAGKLSLTIPARLEDNPSYLNFGSERGRVLYGEDVYVGYRYFEKAGVKPLFPFGYGLSYTTFARSGLSLQVDSEKPILEDGERITASLTVANTGSVAGAETVQLWIQPPAIANIKRPVRELKGFTKVHLQPGEKKDVSITVEKKIATSFWDEIRESWASEKGEYTVLITGTGEEALSEKFSVEKSRYWIGL
ncbi:beta-glucosidase [Talaromyces stipitatus ATCC 10500]|uniref:beta-glucosidase n=1 Tax=Talaromyces stipitatus (strain ATCC 10500 / CBS 375.48 / QM 6759 / NRRL 1006) TaxID=441959 RepID=B8MDH2_TALSN|nr:beta-glucosidase [Talaromyces stipitatus ATCC 10500]EED17935.1 beta-glucosidase [Talaromyces stipitatus ATCC 10500]